MSTLTVSLAVIGGLVLAGVVAHSAWNTRRNAPRTAEPEPAQDLHNKDRTEPRMSGLGGLAGGAGMGSLSTHASEGEIDFALPDDLQGVQTAKPRNDFDSNLVPLAPQEKKPLLDALIDVIAPIVVDGEVAGELALAVLPATRRAGSKPFAVEGYNRLTNEWELPAPGQRYSAFHAGVQLANRTGALNDIEYSEFVVKAQAFADAVGGTPEFPEMMDEVARARELDQFASSHDAQLGFTIRARATAWSPGYVQQHATRQGMVPGVIPGRMVLPASEQGMPPVLGLAFDTQAALADDPEQSALRVITLSLDVPQVARSEQPFMRMRDVAIALAASMDGLITDDQGNVIRVDALDAIGADLEKLYDTLEARDLSAGSLQARRLFS
jgi:ZipA, C-terminal FtsZ-binding domain